MDIRNLVERFGGGVQLARKLSDLTEKPLTEEAIYKWVARERVPPRWHFPLLDLAHLEGVSLAREELAPSRGTGSFGPVPGYSNE